MQKKALILTYILLFLFNLCKASTLIQPQDERIEYVGRFNFSNDKKVSFSWPGSSIKFVIKAKSISFKLSNFSVADTKHYGNHANYYLLVDDLEPIKFACGSFDSTYTFSGYENTVHDIEIYKLTESHVGLATFGGLLLEENDTLIERKKIHQSKIEFIGNSITCGYGLEGKDQHCDFSPDTENNYLSYAAIASREINYSPTFLAWSGKGVLRNYDMDSIHTLPPLYERSIPLQKQAWEFEKYPSPQIVVINLGTNDFAHHNPDSIKFIQAYCQLIFQIRHHHPNAKIVCIVSQMMNNSWPKGHFVRDTFTKYITQLVKELNQIEMKNIYICELSSQGNHGYGCDWHPSKKQHQVNGDELATFLKNKVIPDNE